MSRMSYDNDRSRKYSRSIRIQSSKVTVLRPRTCQTQVSPGSTANRRRCHGLHCSDSSTGNGRGPTSDMSPTSTFHSCGSSSSWCAQDPADPRRARIVPHFEGRSVLHADTPAVGLALVRVGTHRSHLYIRNRRPPFPSCSCVKKIGPGDVSLMIKPITNKTAAPYQS